jgi:hypothetical protein
VDNRRSKQKNPRSVAQEESPDRPTQTPKHILLMISYHLVETRYTRKKV